MADTLDSGIEYNSVVTGIDFEARKVYLEDGRAYSADVIVSTIPWTCISELKGMPEALVKDIKKLKYSSIETRYYEENLDTGAQWIYYPDLSLAYHRILVRSNFCPNSKGYWTETNSQRVDMISEAYNDQFHYMNEYAYPLNTIEKPAIMQKLLCWTESRSVYGLGRWGEWSHYNSDVTVDLAMQLALKLN